MPRIVAAVGPPSSSSPSAASRISSSVRARRGPRRPRLTGAVIGSVTFLDFSLISVQRLYGVQEMFAHDESWRTMAATTTGTGLARATGALFVVGAVAFGAAATGLSSTFGWPDILREPAAVVLPAVVAGGAVWVPRTPSRHATCRYSRTRPPRRSRRSGRTVAPEGGGVRPAGGC